MILRGDGEGLRLEFEAGEEEAVDGIKDAVIVGGRVLVLFRETKPRILEIISLDGDPVRVSLAQ